MTEVEVLDTKLAAARTQLVLDKPFLGALILRLPMLAADPQWCETTATDARRFYYNRDYIAELKPDELQFVLAHEALHCALQHFARRQHRLKHRWDVACDYAINPILLDEGLTPPPGILYEESFAGMSAEEIYPCLDDLNSEQDPLDKHVYDEEPDAGPDQHQQRSNSAKEPNRQENSRPHKYGNVDNGQALAQTAAPSAAQEPAGSPGRGPGLAPQPPPLAPQERDQLDIQWQQRLAGAAQQAQQAGKLSGGLARMVDHQLQPRLPWRMLLARYMSASARDDYSYARPSSRRGDPAIYPGLRSGQLNLSVALDVSGSISEQELQQFLSEVDAIKAQLRATILLHACDSQLAAEGPWYFEAWDELCLPGKFSGGGGTDFRPVFDWTHSLDQAPDLLVYFTDGQGPFPAQPPVYPVIWLIKGSSPVPWGQRVQLN